FFGGNLRRGGRAPPYQRNLIRDSLNLTNNISFTRNNRKDEIGRSHVHSHSNRIIICYTGNGLFL
ncbi:MAG: hypothetical protein IJM59_09510, partial [Proteobacteria bacterium]|nr:hypothetical protein [Pseudomonadota bacterium]